MHSKVRNIPRNTQLRGRLFDKWPRKGLSGACCGPSGEVSGAPTGRGPACSAAQDGGRDGEFRGADGTDRPPGRKKSVPKGRCARRQDAKKVFRGEGAPPPEHIRAQKKTDLGPFTSISATLLCYSTGFCSGMLVRYTLPHDNGSALREPVSFAGDFRQHVLLQQPVCLRFRSARRSGVTAVKASAIRSLSRSAARRSGLSRLAAGISAVRVAPRESLRPPPGSQFSAAGVTVLSRHPVPSLSRPGSRPSAARNLPSLLLAPLRRRGHSTTTSVWPSTCNWRISCVELT